MGCPWARRVILPPNKNTPTTSVNSPTSSINLEKWPYTSQQVGPFYQGPGHPKYFRLEGSNPQVTFVQSFYTLPLPFGSLVSLIWDILRAYKIFMRLADCSLPIYWGAPCKRSNFYRLTRDTLRIWEIFSRTHFWWKKWIILIRWEVTGLNKQTTPMASCVHFQVGRHACLLWYTHRLNEHAWDAHTWWSLLLLISIFLPFEHST